MRSRHRGNERSPPARRPTPDRREARFVSNRARSWGPRPLVEEIERQDLAIELRQPAFPGGHVARAPAPYRGVDGFQVPAIDPEFVGEIGRAELWVALRILAMTGHAIGCENSLPCLNVFWIDLLRIRTR